MRRPRTEETRDDAGQATAEVGSTGRPGSDNRYSATPRRPWLISIEKSEPGDKTPMSEKKQFQRTLSFSKRERRVCWAGATCGGVVPAARLLASAPDRPLAWLGATAESQRRPTCAGSYNNRRIVERGDRATKADSLPGVTMRYHACTTSAIAAAASAAAAAAAMPPTRGCDVCAAATDAATTAQ